MNDQALAAVQKLDGQNVRYVEQFTRDAGDYWRQLGAMARAAGMTGDEVGHVMGYVGTQFFSSASRSS